MDSLSNDTHRPSSQVVAAEIRSRLARISKPQRVFAEELGTGEPWVSRRLSGRVVMTLDDLDLLARALGTDAVELMQAAARNAPAAISAAS